MQIYERFLYKQQKIIAFVHNYSLKIAYFTSGFVYKQIFLVCHIVCIRLVVPTKSLRNASIGGKML